MKDFAWHRPANFQLFILEIWRNYQQNSNTRWWSDAILNISVISKVYIHKNITQHERPCRKQTSKILTCYNEIWRNYQQNSNPRWWSDAILNYKSLSHMPECTHRFSDMLTLFRFQWHITHLPITKTATGAVFCNRCSPTICIHV